MTVIVCLGKTYFFCSYGSCYEKKNIGGLYIFRRGQKKKCELTNRHTLEREFILCRTSPLCKLWNLIHGYHALGCQGRHLSRSFLKSLTCTYAWVVIECSDYRFLIFFFLNGSTLFFSCWTDCQLLLLIFFVHTLGFHLVELLINIMCFYVF